MDSDLTRISDQVKELQDAGADLLHMDGMDGHYVPAFVGGPRMLSAIKRVARIPVDVHIMVSNPEEAADWFIEAGADTILFHAEAAGDASALLEHIREKGAGAGIALNPAMETEEMENAVCKPDCFLAMTVEPGSSGQKFMESGCHKIPVLRRAFGDTIDIYVDGGVNIDTISIAAGYGANVFAMASAIFGSGKPFDEIIPQLRKTAENRVKQTGDLI